jgi:PTS system cellobiose-specific IIB component
VRKRLWWLPEQIGDRILLAFDETGMGESMRILIVCGAGASSTFVALRLRRSAAQRGLDVVVSAGSDSDLASGLDAVDVLLVGPHLSDRYEGIRAQADAGGVAVALLPETIFAARDGEAALDLALAAAGALS